MRDLQEKIVAQVAPLDTAVGPTLVVGLGGTGKDVLFRLRRLIVERYGSLEELPGIQFLLLDTDQTLEAKKQSDIPISDDSLYEKIKFQESETIQLSLSGGGSSIINNIGNFPHIQEWFQTTGKIAALGDLGDGAAQVRMASRLAFYSPANYEAISTKLNGIPGNLGSPVTDAKMTQLFATYNPAECNVHVISSLAGGTGSGTFLDMGFLLKAVMGNYKRTAYLAFPSLFANLLGERRMRANGYAALKELNQYNFGTRFKANWAGTEARYMPPPPYTYTYFLDHLNEAGMFVGKERNSVFQMVAESIFQEFSLGEFSGAKRSVRSNMANFLNNAKIDNFWGVNQEAANKQQGVAGDSFVTRFSSFGQTSISFPTDRVHNACACKLGQEVLNFWQHNVPDDPQEILFTRFLKKPNVNFVQGAYTPSDGSPALDRTDLVDELLWHKKEAQRTLLNEIRTRIMTVRQELEAAQNGSKAAVLQKARDDFDMWLAREDSEDPNEWGQCIRTIDLNATSYLDGLTKGIEAEADVISNDRRYGVVYALALLQQLKHLLRNENQNFRYIPWFDTEMAAWNETAQYQLDELEQVHLDLLNHENSILFRGANVARDIDLLVAADQDAEDQGILYYYLKARVMRQVLKRGKRICEEVDAFLGKDSSAGTGLLGKYYNLLKCFDDLKAGLSKMEEYFCKDRGSMFASSLYRDGDTERWYKRWMGHGEDAAAYKRTISSLGDSLLAEIFRVTSVTDALRKFQTTLPEAINRQILKYFKIHFAKKDDQPSALQLFFEGGRYNEQQQDAIRRAMSNAQVWISQPVGADIPNVKPSRDQFSRIVGVDMSSKLLLGRFEALVKNTNLGDLWQIRSTGESHKDAIHFYTEVAGVPACYPSSVSALDGLRDCYNQFFRNPAEVDPKNQEVLHTDKNRFKFQDIMPKSQAQAITFKQAVRGFVLGRMLGLVGFRPARRNEANSRDAYTYTDDAERFIVARVVELGSTEQDAIDFLYQRDDFVRPRLLEKIQTRLDFLKEDLRRLAKFMLLAEFYRTNLYPPQQDKDTFQNFQFERLLPQYEVLRVEKSRQEDDLSEQALSQLEHFRAELLGGRSMGTLQGARDILSGFTVPSGFYEVQAIGDVQEVIVRRLDSLVLDWDKIQPPAVPTPAPTSAQGALCPLCGKGIDERAIFCRHCLKDLGKHVACGNCGETMVPDFAKKCWKCGFSVGKPEIEIECPRCFAYKATLEKFPCPKCRFDPRNPSATAAANTSAPKQSEDLGSARSTAQDSAQRPEANNEDARHEARPAQEHFVAATDEKPGAQASSGFVECPTCNERVAAGEEMCPHCLAIIC